MANFWVFEVSDGGWHVKADGERLARSRHPDRQEAIAAAEQLIAGSGGGELVIRGRQGAEPERRPVAGPGGGSIGG